MMMMMMTMYFHFREMEYVLFHGWMPMSTVGYVFSCFGVGAIALVYELVRYARYRIQYNKPPPSEESSVPSSDENRCLDCDSDELMIRSASFSNVQSLKSGRHVGDTILYFIQLYGSYSIMLIWMTYNVPLCLSAALGHVLGYFFLGPLMSVRKELSIADCCG